MTIATKQTMLNDMFDNQFKALVDHAHAGGVTNTHIVETIYHWLVETLVQNGDQEELLNQLIEHFSLSLTEAIKAAKTLEEEYDANQADINVS